MRNTIGNFPDYLWLDEAEIVDALIKAVLKRGLRISVHNGEEWAVKQSTDEAEIQREIAATDYTGLRLRNADKEYVGFFDLIHGNRAHVVSDFSDNHLCDEIWNEIQPVVEKWEAQV